MTMDCKNDAGQRGYGVNDASEITADFFIKGDIKVTGDYLDVNGDPIGGGSATTYISTFPLFYNYGGTAKRFIGFGSITDTSTLSAQSIFIPPGAGKLLKIGIYFSSSAGTTVFTLENSTGVVGTKTVTSLLSSTLYEIDFTTGLDSGVNTFDGTKYLGIGIDATNAVNNVNVTPTWEFDV